MKFLDYKHGEEWSIWEFRAEGTGYPDSEVYHRIHHFPWPDHHPPPFALIPPLMASMRNWLKSEDETAGKGASHDEAKKPIEKVGKKRTAVVHCKAGKGRSGTVACSYLISEEGWDMKDALQRFTERRMRVGFGAGVSIPSQLRWIGYVDRWAKELGKRYVERPVEIVEIHVWGLRDGVKVAVEGYVDEGRRIRNVHIFNRKEKVVVDSDKSSSKSSEPSPNFTVKSQSTSSIPETPTLSSPTVTSPTSSSTTVNDPQRSTVLLKPSKPLVLPNSDINIDFERRNKAAYTGFTMVTSVAHVWFNAYFEGGCASADSGVFEIEWDAMDGIKGSARKGTRALDKLKVLWRYPKSDRENKDIGKGVVITEPKKGEPVPEGKAADWRGRKQEVEKTDSNSGRTAAAPLTAKETIEAGAETLGKELGLRKVRDDSADVSRASSLRSKDKRLSEEIEEGKQEEEGTEEAGVKVSGPEGEDHVVSDEDVKEDDKDAPRYDKKIGDLGVGRMMNLVQGFKSDTQPGETKRGDPSTESRDTAKEHD